MAGMFKALRPFKWERMLLRVVVDWARVNGFREARVLIAEKNPWHDNDKYDVFRMHYDVTAKRSGFKFNSAKNAYVLALV